ncbi:MAG: GNAT family N-acetyltransferase [Burkholderiales bacterium RIFCSPHIGHO2_12_FULL_69_20]|nr:MAG: GNAT family N-acetyltransferase [Burkholderiales bacterium RIFCSPHIGHO2_12_FULL_69_20]
MTAATALSLGELRDADRAAWEPLARGYKAFYETEVDAAGYEQAWQRLRGGAPMLGLGAWLPGAAGRGEQLVGIAHAVFHGSVWADRVCYLQDLFVDPAVRGQGVAAALIAHLARCARDHGAARYYWLTHDSNARARRLYDRVAVHHGHIRYDHPLAPPMV